ncbi:uncharacterized protein [Taeniopygia guttata]|uniref:uncharacterized protein n=1 Tax=Taeniopygia guttata TaxID=59729 RepID=UPI003BB8DF20
MINTWAYASRCSEKEDVTWECFTPRCDPGRQVKPSSRGTPVPAVQGAKGLLAAGLRPAETRPCSGLPWAYFTPLLSRSPQVEAIHPKRRAKRETGGMLPGGARRGPASRGTGAASSFPLLLYYQSWLRLGPGNVRADPGAPSETGAAQGQGPPGWRLRRAAQPGQSLRCASGRRVGRATWTEPRLRARSAPAEAPAEADSQSPTAAAWSGSGLSQMRSDVTANFLRSRGCSLVRLPPSGPERLAFAARRRAPLQRSAGAFSLLPAPGAAAAEPGGRRGPPGRR